MNYRLFARLPAVLLLALLPVAFASCSLLYFLHGKGDEPALYTLPKDQRVLVFVDAPPSISLPPGYAASLGDKIGKHLFKYKAATKIVTQDRLTELRNDPTFGDRGIADVAHATDADVIVYVNVITFNVGMISGGTVSRGDAQALVKVVDKNGHHLWPLNSESGMPVDAHVDENLEDKRDEAATLSEISDLLALHVGRIFHSYSLDDPDMTK
jgi:hypothetical protein